MVYVLNKKVNYFFNFQVSFFSEVKEEKFVYLVTAPSTNLSNDLYFFLLWFFNLGSFTSGFSEQDKNSYSLESCKYQFSKRYPYTVFYPANSLFKCNPYHLYFNFIYFLQILEDYEKIIDQSVIDINDSIEVTESILNLRSEVLNIFNFVYFIGVGSNSLVSYTDFQQFVTVIIRVGIYFNSHNWFVLILLRNIFFAFYAGIKNTVLKQVSVK